MALTLAQRQKILRNRRAAGLEVLPVEHDVALLHDVLLRMRLVTQAQLDDDSKRQAVRAIAAKFLAGVVAEHLEDLAHALPA